VIFSCSATERTIHSSGLKNTKKLKKTTERKNLPHTRRRSALYNPKKTKNIKYDVKLKKRD